MDTKKITAAADHTLLLQTATWEDIKNLCDEAMEYGAASVCIPPCYVAQAVDYVGGKLPVCTVIGFPNGNTMTQVKVYEARQAVLAGALELDMVVNIGWVKAGQYDKVLAEIKAIKQAAKGKLLKVIIETCLLSDEEKIKLCEVVSASGADYIKTSTGFSTGGATREDVALMVAHCAPHVKVKAAGGISSLQDAQDFLDLGASRLGTSRVIKILKQEASNNY